MRTWDLFYPDVLPEVLGCPEPLVDRHLQRAARDFFERSHAWREQLTPITTVDERAEYALAPPSESEVARLVGAAIDNRDIGIDVVDGSTLAERLRGNSGPRRILTMDLRTVFVLPTPAGAQTLAIEAELKPTQTAQGLPDALADRFREQIACGALSTLLAMSKQPWSDPATAGMKVGQFNGYIERAKSAAWKGNSNTRPRHRAQFF